VRWLFPVATALWAVWTWTHERNLDRQKEREQAAALYLNPFLSSCEDLQSRIYNLLSLDGLKIFQERYPDGRYAEETTYLIVRFFGWMSAMLRYGPYTHDSYIILKCEKIRYAFATAEYPLGPFTFLRPEQKELGKMVMHRFIGHHGIELDTLPWHDFMNKLEASVLADRRNLQESIDVLKNVKDSEQLPGRQRLARVQKHLVDLLNYVERKEGIKMFPGVRKKCVDIEKQKLLATQKTQASLPPS
jgi:hypothetical protein